jgi:hypothetical protein
MSRITHHVLLIALATGAVALDAGLEVPDALSSAFAVAWGGPPTLADSHRVRAYQEELVFQRSFEIRPGGTLAVDVHDADVQVETGSGTSVEIKLYLHAEDMEWARQVYERARFRAESQGSTVRLISQEVRVDRSDWGADGDVAVGRVKGVVEAHTQDGDVIVGDVEGPRVSIRSQDGDLSMGALAVQEAVIETQDGDVSVESVTGDVRVDTHDGDLRIGLTSVEGASIRTGDGDVTVYLPETFTADVDIQSESIDIGDAFRVTGTVSRHRMKGKMNGGGPPLTVRTGDGSVTVRPASP